MLVLACCMLCVTPAQGLHYRWQILGQLERHRLLLLLKQVLLALPHTRRQLGGGGMRNKRWPSCSSRLSPACCAAQHTKTQGGTSHKQCIRTDAWHADEGGRLLLCAATH